MQQVSTLETLVKTVVRPRATMASYSLQLLNATCKGYTFSIYTKPPKSIGLRTVAWKCRWVPAAGEIPSCASVDWTVDYGVAICNFDQNGKNTTGRQIMGVQLGHAYEVSPGPTINPSPIPDNMVEDGEVKFTNNSKETMEMGFTIDKNIMGTQNVRYGESILIDVHEKYYIALYRSKIEGDAITSDVIAGPAEVTFDKGTTAYKVTADTYGGKVGIVSERVN